MLSLVRTHALLHQQTRQRDPGGAIVATLDDYAAVRQLVAPLVAEGVGATVSPATRETVAVVGALAGAHPDGVPVQAVARSLDLDRSTVARRLGVAGTNGWLVNQEERRGRPGRWALGEPLPEELVILPSVQAVRACAEGCAQPLGDESAAQAGDG